MNTRLLLRPLLIITKAWRQIKHALYINNLWKDYYTVVKRMRTLSILLGKEHWDIFSGKRARFRTMYS